MIAALHLLCQTTKRATVDVTKVSVDDELRTPRLIAGQRLEVVQRTPAVSGAAVVGVPTGGRQIGQVHSVNEHEALQVAAVGELVVRSVSHQVQCVAQAVLAGGLLRLVERCPRHHHLVGVC